jgi:hypothetical protein
LAKLDVRGALIIPAGFGNAAPRPAIGVSRLPGEIAGVGGGTPTLAYDGGFLRISAGGGTNATAKSFIDISGYSTLADMNKNIVLGTSGVERVRIDSAGNVGVGTASPAEKLEVVGNIKLSGATPTYKVTNLIAPTASADAATKGYVDAASSGSPCPTNYANLCMTGGGLSFTYNSKTLYIDAFPRSTYVFGAGAYESQYGLALQHCERIGARLPTLAEWNAACTALGGPAGNGMTTFGGSIASRYEWSATPYAGGGNGALVTGYGSCSSSGSTYDVSTQSTYWWFRCIR